ncbi:hypothetical protein SLE2022_294620 [Rubroshorea leprosula]
MSERIAKQFDETSDYKNPSLGWIIGFLFIVSFRGLFSAVFFQKIMIIDFKLMYPSGTATAHLINSLHGPKGAKLANAGEDCGFANFPTFGLKAYKNRFYFDFSATYVGVGMICPYIVNISLLFGGILSWGLMWPLIDTRKGDWYAADLSSSSMHGLQGYKVFIAIAMILGDGLYNFFKVLSRTLSGFFHHVRRKNPLQLVTDRQTLESSMQLSHDDQLRTQLFLKDQIPKLFVVAGYATIAFICTIALPHIFHQLKWYYILVIFLFAPALAFCNAYVCGLTDWSLDYTYGKLAIFVIGALAGSHGGVLAGLAACGVMMNSVSTASDLMQDFKTGYLTMASPRSMFISQMIGTAFGCVISPCVFWLFYKAFDDLGNPKGTYPAPFAIVFRSMALLGVQGFSALPKDCLLRCYVFFGAAILINLIRDVAGKKAGKFIPIPMAMAIPFYLGPYFAIDVCWQLDIVCLGEGKQGQGRCFWASSGFWFDMWGWRMGFA